MVQKSPRAARPEEIPPPPADPQPESEEREAEEGEGFQLDYNDLKQALENQIGFLAGQIVQKDLIIQELQRKLVAKSNGRR